MFLALKFFWEEFPKILDWHYKIRSTTGHHAKISHRSAHASWKSRVGINKK